MTSAPETISIKRRRDDGVVDVLALTTNKKQRTSGHYFVRLGREHGQPMSTVSAPSTATVEAYRPLTGMPAVGSTLPGDEIKDFVSYRAAQDLRNGNVQNHTKPLVTGDESQPLPHARRFHLTRDLSLMYHPQQGTSRKVSSHVRPHLPTFVEKFQDITPYAEPPIDRIITSLDGANHELDVQKILADDAMIKRETTAPFRQAKPSSAKSGQSIRDDPATWDLTSDRLADELMTLALEMDPVAMAAYRAESILEQNHTPHNTQQDVMLIDAPDDYVYETYVRVQEKGMQSLGVLTQLNNLGYLVIDEDQEELWDQYLRDEDDSDDDWDEEDADSNAEDDPRNDYPEDEVSSDDDEYGGNIYRHRRDYADDGRDY